MRATEDAPSKGAALTRERLIDAGLQAFCTSGFDGTSARQIERIAGVERGLLAYHFGTKQRLWETVVDEIFGRFTQELLALRDALRDVSARERARAILMAYARFSMKNPEFFRIMVLEGYVKSERSSHLAKHIWGGMHIFRDVTDLTGPAPTNDIIVMFQIVGAAGALSAITAYLDDEMTTSLAQPEAIETFARTLATFSSQIV